MSESRHERAVERKRRWVNRKRRIAYRLRARAWKERSGPMFAARNIHYDLAEKDRGLGEGGIGAMHLLTRRVGLIERIDKELHVLKRHLPYHESDHVLNLAYNARVHGYANSSGDELQHQSTGRKPGDTVVRGRAGFEGTCP